jgi:hypothetical protein
MLTAVEPLDSDGDGFSNIAEIVVILQSSGRQDDEKDAGY